LAGLGQTIIRNISDVGRPPASRVSDELDSIIAWVKNSPRCIHSSTATTGTDAVAGLDTLRTITIPANSLANADDWFDYYLAGTIAVNDNNKRFFISFSGVTLLDTGLQDLDGFGFEIYGTIARLTATTIAFTIKSIIGAVQVDSPGAIVAGGTTGAIIRNNNGSALGGIANMTTNASDLLFRAEGTAIDDVKMVKSHAYLIQMT
jgi:hypothetical protein